MSTDACCRSDALIRCLVRTGVLGNNRMKLDYVLGLKIEDFMECRLQTQVRRELVQIQFGP